ncbi:hypothetical protein [Halorussus sp. AFM4]|uniref:hypothetical protein n=1 Tax=Halorussus sp. AFM4 TaxID=3421651 RepID=UPI003EC0B974
MSEAPGGDGSEPDGVNSSSRIWEWVLLEGNRFVVAGGMAGAIAVFIYALAVADVVALGPQSNVRTLLSSGLASGLLTLVTVALSINQLLLSRVFGPPEEFVTRLSGTQDFRERVSRAADASLYENDPEEFLDRIAEAIQDRAENLTDELPDDAPDELVDFVDEVAGYAENVSATIESDAPTGRSNTMDVLSTLLGPEYARALTTIPRLQDEYEDQLSADARVEFEALLELVKSVAVFRQFLKTLAVQQDLARLSRLVAYTGVVALAIVFAMALTYTASSGALVSEDVLQPLVSLGLGVAAMPLTLLVSYVIRVATISRYTVSVGSFIPPEERFQG